MNFTFTLVALVLGSAAYAGTLKPKDIQLRSYIESEDGKHVIFTLEESSKTRDALGSYPNAVFWGPKGGPFQQMDTNTKPIQGNHHSWNRVEYIGGGNWQPYFAFKNPSDDQTVEFKHVLGKDETYHSTGDLKFAMNCGGQEMKFIKRRTMDADKAVVEKQLQSGEAELNYLRANSRETVAALRTKPDAKGNSTYYFVNKDARDGGIHTYKIYSGVPGNMEEQMKVSWGTNVEPRKETVSIPDGSLVYDAAEGASYAKYVDGKVTEKIPLEKVSKAEFALLGVPGAAEFDSTPCDLANNGLDSALLFDSSTECIADGLRFSGRSVSPKYVALVSMYLKREKKFTAAEFAKFVNENGYCQASVYGGIRQDQVADLKNFLKASNNLSNQSNRFNQIFGVNPATVTSLDKMNSGAFMASASMDAGLIKKGKEATHFTACSQQMRETKKDEKLVSALEKSCKLKPNAPAKPAVSSDAEITK